MERSGGRKTKHAVEKFTLPILVFPLVVLSALTAFVLFLSSDPNVNAVFTQCFPSSSEGRNLNSTTVPPVAQIPIVGPPTCCLVSFFHAALDSRRSFVIMNEILAYVGVLLTVTTMESARVCNHSSWLIRNPTAAWLVFNLAGGAVVWQLVIVPSFMSHRRRICRPETTTTRPVLAEREALLQRQDRDGGGDDDDDNNNTTLKLTRVHREVASAELHAIPIAVALGYLVPCIPFLLRPSTWSIFMWLFFPAYVSMIRQLARRLGPVVVPQARTMMHPESSRRAIMPVYAVPLAWSIVAHFWLLYHLVFMADDRSPTTRAALGFVQADFTAIGVTVLYWIVVEAGWRTALLSVLVGCLLGPGAGLCVAWVVREREMQQQDMMVAEEGEDNGGSSGTKHKHL